MQCGNVHTHVGRLEILLNINKVPPRWIFLTASAFFRKDQKINLRACRSDSFLFYWLSSLCWIRSLQASITWLPIAWECKPSELNRARQICVMLLVLSQLHEIWGQLLCFSQLASSFVGLSVCTEPFDGTTLILAWQQINKCIPLASMLVDIKKKCLLS